MVGWYAGHWVSAFHQVMEFHEVITKDAGAGGFSAHVAGYERRDDGVLKLVLQIEHVERDFQVRGYAARIPDIVERTAAPGSAEIRGILPVQGATSIPQLHGEANNFFAGIAQDDSGG